MASFATAGQTSALQVNIFDGSRQLIAPGVQFLITITDGNQRQLLRDYYPSGTVFNVPFYDNFGDNYSVVAYADGYVQAGFVPVKCSPDSRQELDIMLLKKDAGFNFAAAGWDALAAGDPQLCGLLAHGETDDAAARDRYAQLMEDRPAVLACLLNITTALAAIRFPDDGSALQSPLQYFRELIWDTTMAQDRFFAYADPALYDRVKQAASQGMFAREADFALFHPGSTDSYKQIQFGEANVQLTFHANDTKDIDGVQCLMMEPDIDYYKDLAAHALLEVVQNAITRSLTDPRQVYVLRWIAGRHDGVPDFNPPYVIA
jgi:hypothetical protein